MRRRPWVVLTLVFFFLGYSRLAFAQTVFLPEGVSSTEVQGRRPRDPTGITFCIDKTSLGKPFDEAIARAVAEVLLLEPRFHYVHPRVSSVSLTHEVYFIHLHDHCHAFVGLPLDALANYPDFMTFSKPYRETGYVLITREPGIRSLSDVGRLGGRQDVGVLAHSLAADVLMYYRGRIGGQVVVHLLRSDEDLVSAVLNGDLRFAVIWEPSLYALTGGEPEQMGLYVGDVSPLPYMSTSLGFGLLSRDTYLRTLLDQAIDALAEDGVLDQIFAEAWTAPNR